MATPGQLDEKIRQDRAGASAPAPSALEELATPAQLAEKARQDRAGAGPVSGFATSAQLSEKAPQDQTDSCSAAGFATPAQLTEKARPPPLPPRASSTQHIYAPPPYTDADAKRSELISEQWRSHD